MLPELALFHLGSQVAWAFFRCVWEVARSYYFHTRRLARYFGKEQEKMISRSGSYPVIQTLDKPGALEVVLIGGYLSGGHPGGHP